MSHNKQSLNRLQQGFTFIEILIVAPIVILTIGAFITAIVGMTGEVLSSRASNVLAYDVQDALNRIEDDVKLSSTFLATNNITLTSGQGYDNVKGNFSNASVANGEMLILNIPVTTGNPMSISNGIVYLANSPRPCGDAQITGNTPLTMNVIYFVQKNISDPTNSKLWRRTIMPASYLTPALLCGTPWQQPSCAPNVAGTLCTTQDIKLVDGIDATTGFNVDYFNLANDTAANSVASDATKSDSVRGTAIQATATVGITINSAKTVAGRDISQSATLRATRLDINASTIAAVVPDTIPVAPTVTATFVGPDTAKFDWPAVPGASTYTLDYTLDATPGPNVYTNAALNNSTLRTFSITGIRNKIICARVSAKNSAGTSLPNGSVCVTIPEWNALVLQNNWSDYTNGYATSAYTKTSAGVVVLKGLVRKATPAGASETIAILPAGYRPSEQLIFQTETNANVASRVDVTTGGNIILSVGDSGWVSLEGIKFLPSSSGYTFTPLSPLSNSWAIYGSPPFASPAYTLDSSGRVHLNGLVKNGSSTIGILPAAYRPALDLYLPGDATNAFGTFTIQSNGNILPVVYTNSYFSIQGMFYPASYAGWSNLTLQNGWVYYGGLSTPQYTKSADGIVTVKGFIKSGTTASGTVIGNLPAGYRPKAMLLLASVAWNVNSRIDIQPNGDITARLVDAGWTSLDNINFMAEQ